LFIGEAGAIATAQDLATRAGRVALQIAELHKFANEFLLDLPTSERAVPIRCRL